MLGLANATSSIILKWKMQFGCAVVWWAAAVVGVLWHGEPGLDRISGGDFLLPDCVRDLWDDLRNRISAAHANGLKARPMPELPELNPVIHGKLRLALLSLLSGVEEAEFTWLRAKTGSTDGNLGAQLLKLEEAGYVAVEKKFVQRKPQTLYRMTEAGREALTEYVQALKQLLGAAIGA